MPTIYLKLFDPHDQEIMMPYTYGKTNGRKRHKPEPLHIPWYRKVIDGYTELFSLIWRSQ